MPEPKAGRITARVGIPAAGAKPDMDRLRVQMLRAQDRHAHAELTRVAEQAVILPVVIRRREGDELGPVETGLEAAQPMGARGTHHDLDELVLAEGKDDIELDAGAQARLGADDLATGRQRSVGKSDRVPADVREDGFRQDVLLLAPG